MLVDLGRNDLGKISRFGTVQVERFHSIQRFSHVMHIGSAVRGELDSRYDALDAIEAVFPAGTLSGAPKIKACQLIGQLEQHKREFTAELSAILILPEIWIPASPSALPIRKTGGYL